MWVFILCCVLSRFRRVSNSFRPHGQSPTRLLHPWDSPGKPAVGAGSVWWGRSLTCCWLHPGVGCHFLLRGVFLTQRSNPGLSPCLLPRRWLLYHLSHREGRRALYPVAACVSWGSRAGSAAWEVRTPPVPVQTAAGSVHTHTLLPAVFNSGL